MSINSTNLNTALYPTTQPNPSTPLPGLCIFNSLPSDIKKLIFKLAGIESWLVLVGIDKTNRSLFLQDPTLRSNLLAYKFWKKCNSILSKNKLGDYRTRLIEDGLLKLSCYLTPDKIKPKEAIHEIAESFCIEHVLALMTRDMEKAVELAECIKDVPSKILGLDF